MHIYIIVYIFIKYLELILCGGFRIWAEITDKNYL